MQYIILISLKHSLVYNAMQNNPVNTWGKFRLGVHQNLLRTKEGNQNSPVMTSIF